MAEVAIPRNLFADILRLIANCGRRRQPFRREALDCFASDQKPIERCVRMTTKSTFSALGAPMSLAWVHGILHVEGSTLPKSVESGKLRLDKVGIRWMSANSVRIPHSAVMSLG
jgi:hypothetical protein